MNPPISPEELVLVLTIEFALACGYHFVVQFGQGKGLWHISTSVAGGVFFTLLLPTLLWWNRTVPVWQGALVLLACFGSSGLPMTIGSMYLTTKKSHKAHALPPHAKRAIQDVVLDLNRLADKITAQTEQENIKVKDMAGVVNELHHIKGALVSLQA